MDAFKRALEYIRRMWGNLGTSQRAVLGAAAAAMALFLAWGSVSTAGEGMVRVVGHEVDDATRADVLKKLQEKNEKYEVRDRDIYVPREVADRVVLELAGDGVMNDRAVWQFLDSSDIVISKWQLEKRYQVALSRRLEIMIRHIEFVKNARVLLTPASEAQQLGFQGPKATAAVQLELQPSKSMSRGNVMAIAGLVARAVPGLEMEQVVITDTRGGSYRVPRADTAVASGELRDLEARLEEDIKVKITDLFPLAKVVVRVMAKTSDIHLREKKYGKQVPKMEQEQQRVVKNEPTGGTGGIKGEGQLIPDRAAVAASSEKETSTHNENLVDELIREQRDPAGAIEKVTVGVLVPQDPDDKNNLKPEEVKALVAKAAGITAATDDVLSVMFVPSKKPEPLLPTPLGEKVAEWLGAKWTTVAMIVLAFVALLLVFKVLKGAMPKGSVEEIQAITAQLTASPEIEMPQAVLGGADNINRVKQSIQDVINRNPASAAVGIKQWMGEGQK